MPALARPVRHGAVLLAALAAATAAGAQTYPKFTGFVVDAANVIPDAQEAALTQTLDGLQQRTGRQLVVATVPTLEGRDIAEYGVGLIRAWGVGLKDVNNGAVLIVAPADRKVRVEVGQGLEPVLTDAFSSQVIRRDILPPFRAGDLPKGITDGTNALVTQLSLPDAEALAKVREAMKEQGRETGERSGGGFPLPLIFWGIVAAFVLLTLFRGGGGGSGGGGGGRKKFRSRDGSSVWIWGPIVADVLSDAARGSRGGGFGGLGGDSSGGGGGWMDGGFGGGGGGSGGGGGASGSW